LTPALWHFSSPTLFAHKPGFLCYLKFNTSNSADDQESIANNFQLLQSLISQGFQRLVTVAALVGPLSAAFGCGARVLHFKRYLDGLETAAKATPATNHTLSNSELIHVSDGSAIVQLSNVSVQVPHSAKKLVSGLSLTVPGNALLMGPSGCGKSSVLRAIAGLWPAEGHIKAPAVGRAGLCFLTQRPYMCPLSLRQNVAYPSQDYLSDADLKKLLVMSGLSELFHRMSNFDEILDWANILSLGEQQRIAFARCFHMMPSVAILDESTSALDPHNEELLYQTLRCLKIHFISVGHRSQLKAFHDQIVVFDGNGGFVVTEIQAVPVVLPPQKLEDVPKPSTNHQKSYSLETVDEKLTRKHVSFLPLLNLCFWKRDSQKNLMTHFLILCLFVVKICSPVYTKDATYAPGVYYFKDTSANDALNFLLIPVLSQALLETIINALIAYVALRTRKNLCRGMHSLYFSGNV
jgi:ABC-type iron transport system FetAB ATPase subunit